MRSTTTDAPTARPTRRFPRHGEFGGGGRCRPVASHRAAASARRAAGGGRRRRRADAGAAGGRVTQPSREHLDPEGDRLRTRRREQRDDVTISERRRAALADEMTVDKGAVAREVLEQRGAIGSAVEDTVLSRDTRMRHDRSARLRSTEHVRRAAQRERRRRVARASSLGDQSSPRRLVGRSRRRRQDPALGGGRAGARGRRVQLREWVRRPHAARRGRADAPLRVTPLVGRAAGEPRARYGD